MVYADYELDCHGYDFSGSIPDVADPSKRSLKRFGQLTSHGNPPPLEFTATHTGQYAFMLISYLVDILLNPSYSLLC